MKVHYAIADRGLDFEDSYVYDTNWDPEHDLDYIVEECAADFHSNYDGWECEWPLTLNVWNEAGKLLGSFTVERECEPIFSAYEIENKNE